MAGESIGKVACHCVFSLVAQQLVNLLISKSKPRIITIFARLNFRTIMPTLHDLLTSHVTQALSSLYKIDVESLEFQATRRDFEGDVTLVVFPLLKLIKSSPAAIGQAIGAYL
ncbi:MAG: hypothetical protein EOO68_25600, partial [Moraxellaceae bacterium]